MTRPYFGSRNRLLKPVGGPLASPSPGLRRCTADQTLSFAPRATALDRYGLQKAGFTHVLNAAHGRWNVDTGPDYYRGMAIEYHGVEADDLPTFDLSVFFHSAAAFIDAALRADHSKRPAARGRPSPRGKGGLCAPSLLPAQSRPCQGSVWTSWKCLEAVSPTERAAGRVQL